MFNAHIVRVHRSVTVRADLVSDAPEGAPEDLRVAYHQKTKIRPDTVWADFTYREKTGQWEAGTPKVGGPKVLKSGATGEQRYTTHVAAADQSRFGGTPPPLAPWAFQWVESILRMLNDTPVPEVSGTLALDLPDLDLED